MTDFVFADLLCCEGGYIVLDDAMFPAIETVINYIKANRPDYDLVHLPVINCSVAQKVSRDRRNWDAFTPFAVPDRHDWTPAPARVSPPEKLFRLASSPRVNCECLSRGAPRCSYSANAARAQIALMKPAMPSQGHILSAALALRLFWSRYCMLGVRS
jgi:hypothetical protein